MSKRHRSRYREPDLSRPEVRDLIAGRPYRDPAPRYSVPVGGSGSRLERDEGAALHLLLTERRLIHTHVVNERQRGRSMQSVASQGMVSGWPDYVVVRAYQWPDLCGDLIWRPGLYIELKRRTGWTVSASQARCIRALWSAGAVAEICWGADHALAVVDACLGETR
jgi:hypothetical protein